MADFIYSFSQSSLNESDRLIRSAEELNVKPGSMLQIYDDKGQLIIDTPRWSTDPSKDFSINWEGDVLDIDLSYFAPISGTWGLHFDQSCICSGEGGSGIVFGTNEFTFSNSDLDSSGKLVLSKAQLSIVGEPIVQLYDNKNKLVLDGPYWTDDPSKKLSIGWEGDNLVVDLSVFYPISGTWRVKFDVATEGQKGSGYVPRETSESIQAAPSDLVICLRGGLVISLPERPAAFSAVKVAAQLIESPISIIPASGSSIGNDPSFDLIESYSAAEFIYNAENNVWRLISPVKVQHVTKGGYAPVEVSANFSASPDDLVICNVGGIEVILPETPADGSLIKVAMQRITSPVQILSSGDDFIDGTDRRLNIEDEFASVELCYSAAEKTWKIITPHIPRFFGSEVEGGHGYDPVEVKADYKASADDFVICRGSGFDVVLPSNPDDETMVKVAAQEFGAISVLTDDGSHIAGLNSLLIRKNSSAEFVYNAADREWRVVAVDNPEPEEVKPDHSDSEVFMPHESNIRTREQFRDWIFRKLGYPLVSVELTTEQLDDAIDDAIVEFSEYAYQIRRYYAFELSLYRDEGFEMPGEVVGVDHVDSNLVGPNAIGAGKIDNYMNDLIANGAVGFPLLGRPAGSGWFNYELAMSYLDLSQRMLGGDYQSSYDVRTRKLVLDPNPRKVGQTSGWIVCHCQCLRPDDKQFGEVWVKNMALALAKITLGEVRNKFKGVNFPGGGSLSDDVRVDGLRERDELRINLRERFPVIDIFLA